MTRTELKSQLEAAIDNLVMLTSRLRDLPETVRVVRVTTRIEGAIDDLRYARDAARIAPELDR